MIHNLKTEEINDLCMIANKYGYRMKVQDYIIYISPNVYSFYNTEVYCQKDEDSNQIIRFSISFSGFGVLEEEKENYVYNNLVRAKKMVDELNSYIKFLEKKKGKI